MNDKELIEELRRARKGRVDDDMKVGIIVEGQSEPMVIDSVSIIPPAQAKQMYGVEGHRFVLYTRSVSEAEL